MSKPPTPDLREALRTLGYREVEPRRWAKVVGFHLLTYSEEHNQWCNSFEAPNGKVLLWESKAFVSDAGDTIDYIGHLKEWEAYTRYATPGSVLSRFHELFQVQAWADEALDGAK